ncbi:MAG: hypothetical protein ACRDLD_07060 [Thermoleophilaceae bacterium]
MTVSTLPRPAAPLACAPIECMWPRHGVQTLVGDVSKPIDIVGEPGEPPRQSGRDHVDPGRRVEDQAHPRRQLVHVSDSGIGDEQEPLDRRAMLLQAGVASFDVRSAHGWLTASCCLAARE